MTNTNPAATELDVLVSLFATTKPRTVAAAQAGCPNALRSLELAAINLEIAESACVAVINMLDRGLSLGAIATTAHMCSKRARSDRGRIILRAMARYACAAAKVQYQGDFE